MIVYATKLSIRKAVVGILVLGAVAVGVVALRPQAEGAATEAAGSASAAPATEGVQAKLKTNEDRVRLLEGYGWKVEPEPISEREVQIPKVFDENYEAYNAVQLQQGLDLTPYQGKRATLYTYAVLDYPTGEPDVVANLIVRKNHLLAADISANKAGGFMHGITELPE